MLRFALIPLLPILATPIAFADGFECSGQNPDWQLSFDSQQARFTFPSPTDMDVMLQTKAEGREWPRAYTLIGDRDTAIVLLDPVACSNGTHSANVLTQRGTTAILLAGCCEQRL